MLWTHQRELPKDLAQHLTFPDTNRNLAIYGNLIIARGSDDHIYAVDAQTGKLAWERTAREEAPHEASHQDNGTWASSSAPQGAR